MGDPDPRCERTFIMVKPDGVQRALIGEVIKRFEQKGYKLVALKFLKVALPRHHNRFMICPRLLQPSLELIQEHYADLKTLPFYDGLCKFMSSGPVAAMVRCERKDTVCCVTLSLVAGVGGYGCCGNGAKNAGRDSSCKPRTFVVALHVKIAFS